MIRCRRLRGPGNDLSILQYGEFPIVAGWRPGARRVARGVAASAARAPPGLGAAASASMRKILRRSGRRGHIHPSIGYCTAMSPLRPISEFEYRLMKPGARLLSRLQVGLYRLSGGRLGARFRGGEVCVVHMTGAKSGRALQLPLMYVPYQGGVLLVASFAGGPHHPAWYHNLVAHPHIEVEWGGQRKVLTARLATATEKAALWPLCVKHYGDFDRYQQRTTRDIPLFICAPSDSDSTPGGAPR